jgi:hypothetical protein
MAVAGIAFGGWVTAPAQAATVNDQIAALLTAIDGAPPLDDVTPVVFEDDDFTWVVGADGSNKTSVTAVGDKVSGIIQFKGILAGTPKTNDATIVGKTTPQVSLGAGGVNELTGAFELVVTGFGVSGSGDVVAIMGAPATYTQALSTVSPSAGTVFALFEDPATNFSTAGATRAADVGTAVDGTLWAEVGFTGVGTEYYHITDVADVLAGEGFILSELIEASLNFVTAPPPLPAPWTTDAFIVKNSLGTDLFSDGQLKKISGATAGSKYVRTSDADVVLVYVPLPSASWAGLGLLSALGGAHFWRRRRQA